MKTPIEREILIAILKKTKESNIIRLEDISVETRFARTFIQEALKKFYEENFLDLEEDKILISNEQRMKIAVKAINLGSDIERVGRFLTWSEFEKLSKISFEANSFSVRTNFHFTWMEKKWEVDIIGLKKPLIISADCKHWHQKWSGTASVKAAKSQLERTKALAEASAIIKGKIGISGWKYAYFVPIVLSLFPSQYKFYEGIPIVPILHLRDFLQNIIAHLEDVNSIYVSYKV
ncbi:MAG: hypothetical protein QXK89_04865 [Candidatus Bathyarchaeia archaeon]